MRQKGTVVEEFKTRELMLEREKELREKGHRPDRSTESVPVTWEMRWRLTYSPEMRKRRQGAREVVK